MPSNNFMWFPDSAKGGLLKGNSAKPEGETADAWFSKKKALELMEFTFGLEQADTTTSGSSGSGGGKVKFNEFEIKKGVDLASVPLYQACAAGAHFPSVMLAILKPGGERLLYIQYIFCQVFVTNISWSGGGGEEAPSESVKFKFGALGVRYVQQLPNGQAGKPMEGAWSVVTNEPSLVVKDIKPPSYLLNSQS